jgi:hypothetical protein
MAKKQHYVPRLLLGSFSADAERKTINIHLLNSNCFKLSGSLYEQAQKNYLYGADQKLEKLYSLLESETASAIKKLAVGDLDLTNEERLHLKLFVMYQLNRTPGSVELYNDSIESMTKSIVAYDKHLKDYLNEFTIGINKPYMLLFKMATKALHVILDLRIGLLESNVKIPFVLGQNPVIRLNPFLKAKGWMWSTQGLILKGLMIIMPITPQFSIILYDGRRYTLINKNPKWLINDNDINLLNRLQYLNTNECIYFHYNPDINYYQIISQETQAFRNDTKAKIEVLKSKIMENGEAEKTMNSGLVEYPIKQQFGFYEFKQYGYLEKIDSFAQAKREVMPNFIVDEINRIRSNRHST